MLTDLRVDTIGNLDEGRAEAMVNAALRVAAADMEDRGHDGLPRKVKIEVTMQKDGANVVLTTVAVKADLPPYRSDKTACKLGQRQTRQGPVATLLFQEFNSENPDQGTLPAMDEAGGEVPNDK